MISKLLTWSSPDRSLSSQPFDSYVVGLSPFLSLETPSVFYLLAVHFQILTIDLHAYNDYFIIPLPPDGCVPETARVKRVVNTANDLREKEVDTYVLAQESGSPKTEISHFSGCQDSLHITLSFFLSNPIMPCTW